MSKSKRNRRRVVVAVLRDGINVSAKTPRRSLIAELRGAIIEQDHELGYWSEKLGVSREQLRKAMQAAGPMVKDVRRHLRG